MPSALKREGYPWIEDPEHPQWPLQQAGWVGLTASQAKKLCQAPSDTDLRHLAQRHDGRPVSAETTNALVTEAPLTTAELTLLMTHFRALYDALQISGPRFTQSSRDAVDMHNRAVRRLKGIRDEAKRREMERKDDDLMEIGR